MFSKGCEKMNQMKVVFQTPEEINEFVNIVKNYPYDMDLEKGRIIIDAKSILGIMNFGVNNEVILKVHAEFCEELKSDLERFVAA